MTTRVIITLSDSEANYICETREYFDSVQHGGCEIICITPAALEVFLRHGIDSARIPPSVRALHTTNHAADIDSLESAFTDQLKGVGIESSIKWNRLFLEQFIEAHELAGKVANALMVDGILDGKSVLIPTIASPGDYHTTGSMVRTIICRSLERKSINCELIHTEISCTSIETYKYLPIIDDNNWPQDNKGTYLNVACAVFYPKDMTKYTVVEQFIGNKHTLINYPQPKFYAFNFSISKVEKVADFLQHTLGAAYTTVHEICCRYAESILLFIEELNGISLPREVDRQHQLIFLTDRFLLQVATYVYFLALCAQKRIQGFVTSIHDGGINGPMYAIAESLKIPVMAIPHSAVFNRPTEGAAVCLTEYWQPGETRTAIGNLNPTIFVRHSSPSVEFTTKPSAAASTAIVIYNGIGQVMPGFTSLQEMSSVSHAVVNALRSSGWQAFLRLKPGPVQTPPRAYCELLNIDYEHASQVLTQPLESLLLQSKIAININGVSTALWHALELGVACICILPVDKIEIIKQPSDEFLYYDIESGIALLRSLLLDPLALDAFTRDQQKIFKAISNNRDIMEIPC